MELTVGQIWVIKFIKIRTFYGSLFSKFRNSSGTSWEPSCAFRGGLRHLKALEHHLFFKVFVNAGLMYFEALDEPLGAHLGSFLARSGPRMDAKITPKVD